MWQQARPVASTCCMCQCLRLCVCLSVCVSICVCLCVWITLATDCGSYRAQTIFMQSHSSFIKTSREEKPQPARREAAASTGYKLTTYSPLPLPLPPSHCTQSTLSPSSTSPSQQAAACTGCESLSGSASPHSSPAHSSLLFSFLLGNLRLRLRRSSLCCCFCLAWGFWHGINL